MPAGDAPTDDEEPLAVWTPTDDDYADLASHTDVRAAAEDDAPVELITDEQAEERATQGSGAPTVRSRKMRVRLGLPAEFFVPERDADFARWDALYPPVDRVDVDGRVDAQLDDPALREALLDELMSGASALRHYPSGIPPPAAVRPIRPPMREGAQLLFTHQHPQGAAADAARMAFADARMAYGVDEPTLARSQMPVFTIPKPGTTERRVLFDASGMNSLNLLPVGVQLAAPQERTKFLRDARIVSSLDLASFFTTIRLHEDVRDYWAYQRDPHNRVRTARLVQGAASSPAIAQALVEQVVGEVPELNGNTLIYIDNIVVKSTDGNMDAHIRLLGRLTRALAEYNLLLNLKKSIFCGVRD
ncbi:hypothetical protein IWQ57_005183, partial [Coemansia nantahalensis]